MGFLKYLIVLVACHWSLNSSLLARPSAAEKLENRTQFWGLFADNYLAINCFAAFKNPVGCAEVRIQQAENHASSIDHLLLKNRIQFKSIVKAARNSLDAEDFQTAKGLLEELKNSLTKDFAANIAPAVVPNLKLGFEKYMEHCQGCHGSRDSIPGKLQKKLKMIPQSLNASWRYKAQSALGIYAVLIHGVDGSEMLPAVEVLDIDELWSIAFYVMSLISIENFKGIGEDFHEWILERADEFSLVNLAQSSDEEMARKLNRLGRNCGRCLGELSYLRRDWLAKAPRLGDYAKDERKSAEARGLIILIVLVAVTSVGFGLLLTKRRRVK